MNKYNLINIENIIGYDYSEIKEYLRYNGISKFDSSDVAVLKDIVKKIDDKSGFNISYVIERLDKEFDLIKVGNKKLINIELKSSERDLDQCDSNYNILKKHYNEFDVQVYCYEEKRQQLYKYDNSFKVLEKTDFDTLNDELNKIKTPVIMNVDFNITSAYQNPNYYLEKNYSLSRGQVEIKEKIINTKDDQKCILVSGRAGTGKTLLALDLFRYYKESGYTCKMLAPFKINYLINHELQKKIGISTAKGFIKNPKEHDVIIIDEAQRIDMKSYIKIKNYAHKKLILIGDVNQRLEYESCFNKLYERKKSTIFSISQIIRTDDTFDAYARKVLNLPKEKVKKKNLDLEKIKILIKNSKLPDLSEYVFIEPAKSKYYGTCEAKCENKLCDEIGGRCMRYISTYDVVSQEYSKIAISMCHKYYINASNELCAGPGVCYANFKDQMYTIMTRPIDELVIIVDNIMLYNYLQKCLEELKK